MRPERRLKPAVNINFVPLIDVLLILIIFFMITTTFKVAPGIALQLPGSSTAQNVQSSVIRVVAVSEKEIYVDKARTDVAGLAESVRNRVRGADPSALKATVEGDANSSYQLMVSVLDALRGAGVESVALRTRATQGGP